MVHIRQSGKYHIKTIPVFSQILYGDFSASDINSIITQHAKYGMISDDALVANLGVIIPYIYSLDAPVSDADFRTLIDNN